MNIDLLRQAGGVTRYHTERNLRLQSVAEHSWNVALLVLKFNPDARKELVVEALLHDTPEVFTGDVPAPAKWASTKLNAALRPLEIEARKQQGTWPPARLTKDERTLLKFCDGAELLLWCLEEARMGNRYTYPITKKVLYRLAILHEKVGPQATEFFLTLLKETKDVYGE